MSILSKLFGGKGNADAAEPSVAAEEYKGYKITPTPAQDGKSYRIGARIEKEIDGEVKVHDLIRADTLPVREDAEAASVAKAKVMIDQMGDRVFR
ncbi:HlyU family transcriptional regulator [Flavimaricola marinus]|uniref:Transcriptional activator HlyU n=1 Tax=Flavimaricola marinus TaxID=1819565 RepID=A0A238LH41_9RHOB|nr:HlyU family transcriptional regulator [Flavimaricola marinus]SMY08724.1 Transcriptional activator HlyU [Flavimaricola marinus]